MEEHPGIFQKVAEPEGLGDGVPEVEAKCEICV